MTAMSGGRYWCCLTVVRRGRMTRRCCEKVWSRDVLETEDGGFQDGGVKGRRIDSPRCVRRVAGHKR